MDIVSVSLSQIKLAQLTNNCLELAHNCLIDTYDPLHCHLEDKPVQC